MRGWAPNDASDAATNRAALTDEHPITKRGPCDDENLAHADPPAADARGAGTLSWSDVEPPANVELSVR
jgi:hypothetical protein